MFDISLRCPKSCSSSVVLWPGAESSRHSSGFITSQEPLAAVLQVGTTTSSPVEPNRSFSYYALTGTLVMAFVGGYTVFLPGRWDIPTFFFSYTMIGVIPLLFLYWKIVHRTQVSTLHIYIHCPRLSAENSGEEHKT